MDVKFVAVERNLVDTVPIVDGQLVACKDSTDLFYDMGQTRKRVGAPMWQDLEDDVLNAGFMMSDATQSIIQLVPNGGSNSQLQEGTPENFIVGTVGSEVGVTSIPTPTRDGYTFVGWFEDQACQGNPVQTFPARFVPGRTIYYASWIAV